MQHRPLKKLLATNIVEAYDETYNLQGRIRNQPLFLEDRKFVWVDESQQDLLERMVEEAEINVNVHNQDYEIVEEYRPRGLQDPSEYRKLIASSSEQEVPDRRDSSTDSIKRDLQKGYDTDQRSDHSDFSRKESY